MLLCARHVQDSPTAEDGEDGGEGGGGGGGHGGDGANQHTIHSAADLDPKVGMNAGLLIVSHSLLLFHPF